MLDRIARFCVEHLESMSVETGRRTISSRIAYGAIYIKQAENWTDEGCDLKSVVEVDYKRFDFYPEVVLAERISQIRENRRYCKELESA